MQLFNDICGLGFSEHTALITTTWGERSGDINKSKAAERHLLKNYWSGLLGSEMNENGDRVVQILGHKRVIKLNTGPISQKASKGTMYVQDDDQLQQFAAVIRQIIDKPPAIPCLQEELERGVRVGNTTAAMGLNEIGDRYGGLRRLK